MTTAARRVRTWLNDVVERTGAGTPPTRIADAQLAMVRNDEERDDGAARQGHGQGHGVHAKTDMVTARCSS